VEGSSEGEERTVLRVALCFERSSASGLFGGSFSSFPSLPLSLDFLEDFDAASEAAAGADLRATNSALA
jgi:hypothetical protein